MAFVIQFIVAVSRWSLQQ